MTEEYEVKFLNIDVPAIEARLAEIGAVKQFDRIYRRRIFDYPDLRLNAQAAWIRVRDEGDKVTLTYKQRLGTSAHDGSSNDGGMDEVELVVSDFEKTALFFEKIGLKQKFYEEERRVRYELNGIEFDIDYWPALPPYLEIEAGSWEKVEEGIRLLGLNPNDKKVFSTFQVYALHGIDQLDYAELTFDGLVKRA